MTRELEQEKHKVGLLINSCQLLLLTITESAGILKSVIFLLSSVFSFM